MFRSLRSSPLPQSLALLVGGFVGGLMATSLVGADAAPNAGLAAVAQDTAPAPFPENPAFATGDSNDSMIAVTGVDRTGASVLYLIDTENRQLACYQANGGSSSTQSVKLVGARRIDLDLQLHGFKDESDYGYRDLEREFAGLDGDDGE